MNVQKSSNTEINLVTYRKNYLLQVVCKPIYIINIISDAAMFHWWLNSVLSGISTECHPTRSYLWNTHS